MIESTLKCSKCNHSDFEITDNTMTCKNCGNAYPRKGWVIDTLTEPSKYVLSEYKGISEENNLSEDWKDLKIQIDPNIKGYEEKLESTKSSYGQYYEQTMKNFLYSVEHINPKASDIVLEIGSTYDFYFARHLEQKYGVKEIYGLNIHYDFKDNEELENNLPYKIVADMNDIPLKENSVDIVIISATSHHSGTLDILMKEISRVLRAGGRCAMINDPCGGILKSLGGPSLSLERNIHINENEYPIMLYNKLFKENGLSPYHFFSKYHEEKLMRKDIHPETRFYWIAKFTSYLYSFSWFQSFVRKYLLFYAQLILGVPLNVILTKKQ